jgi:hypothetical protein
MVSVSIAQPRALAASVAWSGAGVSRRAPSSSAGRNVIRGNKSSPIAVVSLSNNASQQLPRRSSSAIGAVGAAAVGAAVAPFHATGGARRRGASIVVRQAADAAAAAVAEDEKPANTVSQDILAGISTVGLAHRYFASQTTT